MTDTEILCAFIMLIWFVGWLAIVAILKATQTEEEKQDETYCYARGIPYMSDTDFWTGISIFWPFLAALMPFYLFYKAIYCLVKKK